MEEDSVFIPRDIILHFLLIVWYYYLVYHVSNNIVGLLYIFDEFLALSVQPLYI